MNVVEIMTEKPVTIGLDKSLSDALETMQSVSCHHLPVVGSNDHLVGIIGTAVLRSIPPAPCANPGAIMPWQTNCWCAAS